MTKEMIISANVHEKKVAILEEGLVTEFYVERGDENQGVVGNLYKGRVMKVLPGMQSAFVDIGLERDAFLYVSDFTELMEEEEVGDVKEVAEQKPTRFEDRARRTEARHAKVEPTVVAALDEPTVADAVEQLAEIAVESVIAEPTREEEVPAEPEAVAADLAVGETFAATIVEEEPETERPARRGRGRRKGATSDEAKTTRRTAKKGAEGPEPPQRELMTNREPVEPAEAAPAPTADSQFERVTDEDLVQEAGELLKDALVQERIIERVHIAEYSSGPEPAPEWHHDDDAAGSRTESEFHRIVDDSPLSSDEENPHDIMAASKPDELETPPMRHISEVLPRGFFNRARARLFGGMQEEPPELPVPPATPSEQIVEAEVAQSESEPPVEDDKDDGEDGYDREARVSDTRGRAELAVRRGGRGRRRRREPAPAPEEEKAVAETPTPAAETPTREAESESVEAASPDERAPAERFQSRYRRPEAGMRTDRRVDKVVPTISELLHEGQEILVQIAKEPIARKGARITSHIALPGRYLVYMPTVNHIGVSRKIASEIERIRLKRVVTTLRDRESAGGGFIVRTACSGHTEQELHDDMRYLLRTWGDVKKKAERSKAPALVHHDLDLVQRILRDHLSDEFSAIRIDNEVEYARMVEFVNRIQPKLVKRVKLYTGQQPILEKYNVQPEIDKAVKPRVWLKSGGYIVINQTEALVAIDVNTGKFVGKSDRLEDTITRTNLEAVKEIVRQIRLRDLGGIIVVDLIDMEERKNRQRVMNALQQELQGDRAPSKILSINDFGLVAITRKRVKQSLERTLCTPCPYCQGAGMVKSAQTMCFEILEQAKAISKQISRSSDVTLRVSPEVADAFRSREREVFEEIEAYFITPITVEADPNLHREQFDFAIV